ncbi:SDR family NAD(P)-dependent oxidoreductase [Siccirubricoccus phaeus]|uniref:SDR family NAD(P)-dependent oxidoreductase n=1 Tax=Siccirubricoccus phaeus TaxID=2595053 RepID=UPI00165C9E12|nr:SDR family NAD(P)-dependent oxidoreductase [Siccirubricoccus phaeus]
MQFVPKRSIGQTAIVTGTGSGIGRATAARLLQEGARVVATDIDENRLAGFGREKAGGTLLAMAGDICREEVVRRIVEACAGRVDAFANMAGIMDGVPRAAEVAVLSSDSGWSAC